MRLRFFHQLVDLLLAETAGGGDPDRLLFLRRHVFCRDVNNAVGIDVERDLHLGNAAGRRGNSDQVKLAEEFVVIGHLPFSLEDPDRHGGLVVGCRREGLPLFGWNGGIPVDDSGEDPSQCFDSQGKRRHIEQEDVFDFPLQNRRLDGGPDGNDLVRIDPFVRLSLEELFHDLLHLRHPGHSPDQHHLIDIGVGHAGIGEGLFARLDRLFNQVVHQLLQLCAGQFDRKMFRSGSIRRDEGKIDLRLLRGRELDFRLLGRFF